MLQDAHSQNYRFDSQSYIEEVWRQLILYNTYLKK